MTDDALTGSADAAADDSIVQARWRAGSAIRELGHAFIGRHATVEQIEHLTDVLEAITAELWPAELRTRNGLPFANRQMTEYPQGRFDHDFDDRPVSGKSSPWGLDLELHRHGDEIEAHVTLRSAHEGAPNRSHGGVVAALFDDVFGFVLGVVGQPAFTGDLYIRYRAPVPLHRRLVCRVRMDERQGRKLLLSGELVDVETGRTVTTARATFVAVDREAFARMTAERPAPPDEDR
ncbi:MAG: PaaI family thioesterase [Ilumatobacter sp.]|uniref:PaaI family thioesterase n=1 Tax=Ilumatobacter sp. TaxID=1967498 RepID=UPI0026358236|nr:PaaI family thioesterase [Ilumatobacter sp.]MDJ0768385.1 PaaI family thioesterase [Ilumatobacter sp.]